MFILASSSPRRRELLQSIGAAFIIKPSSYEEDNARHMDPKKLVVLQAAGKAEQVYRSDGTGLAVLGADTLVVLNEQVMGKPTDKKEAEEMLHVLSGRTHEVMTGVALIFQGRTRKALCRTEVVFRTVSDKEIRQYVATGEPLDKAGAYAIQGGARSFVAELRGSYSNVIGLPLALTRRLLEEEGVPWQ